MAIRKVARLGNPVLRKKADPIPIESIASPEIQTLIDDMFETKDEYTGIGLAAPQVHESVQLIVLGANGNARYPDTEHIPLTVVINPKITDFSGDLEEDWEGCLSVKDLWGKVKRSAAVTVQGYNRQGEPIEIVSEGFLARVLQHEIDHLHGKVFLDRMSDLSTLSFWKEYARYGSLHDNEE